jgi:ribosomal protein RSM22 (predicted rRNA methylase)
MQGAELINNDLIALETLLVQEILGDAALLQYQQGRIAKKHLEPHVASILALSAEYNKSDRSAPIPLKEDEYLAAYSLYFLPVNYFKLRVLYNSFADLRGAEKIRMLDFGCGPGTASLAALDHFNGNAEIALHDISPSAVKTADDLIKRRWPNTKTFSFKKNAGSFDLIVAANALNEIDDGTCRRELIEMTQLLSKDGVLVILETALREKTRRAMAMRDFILANSQGLVPLFPCTHTDRCPMLAKNDNDWCHGVLSWNGTRLTQQLDELTGFNKHRLKYTAFIFKRGGELNEGLRVVGVGKKSKMGYQTNVCGPDYFGELVLLKRNRSEKNRILERSDLLSLIKINNFSKEKIVAKDAEVELAWRAGPTRGS